MCLQDIAVDGRVTRRFVVPDNDLETLMAWAEDDDDPAGRSSEARLAIRVNNLPRKFLKAGRQRKHMKASLIAEVYPSKTQPAPWTRLRSLSVAILLEGIVIDEYSGLSMQAMNESRGRQHMSNIEIIVP